MVEDFHDHFNKLRATVVQGRQDYIRLIRESARSHFGKDRWFKIVYLPSKGVSDDLKQEFIDFCKGEASKLWC